MNSFIHKYCLLSLSLIFSLAFFGCSNPYDQYDAFGERPELGSAASIEESLRQMKPGDTLAVKFMATVDEVCQAKGCWMTLAADQKVRVTFKDYGFFVPKDIQGREVMVEGVAIAGELEESLAQHYAEDAGKPYTEDMRKEISIVASGVLVKKAETQL